MIEAFTEFFETKQGIRCTNDFDLPILAVSFMLISAVFFHSKMKFENQQARLISAAQSNGPGEGDSVLKEINGIKIKTNKKLAWTISLLNSFVTTVFGIFYVFSNASFKKNFFHYGPKMEDMFYSVGNAERIACIWFAVACITDLFYGVIFYPKNVDPLTGYFHHSFFIW